jgi:hypothetical protein
VGLEYAANSPSLLFVPSRIHQGAGFGAYSAGRQAELRPNPSLNRTRYGKRRKPGLRHMVHHLSPGLRRLPPQAG